MTSTGYDGVIRIDTSINANGMNTGIKGISRGFEKLKKSLGGLSAVLGGLVSAMGSSFTGMTSMIGNAFSILGESITLIFTKPALAAVLAVFAAITAVVSFITMSIASAFNMAKGDTADAVQEIKDRFKDLKAAIANAFLPLIIAALPYIKMVISWLINLFNKISMITAAFLGQSHVLQVIEGSTQAVADNMETTTKEAKKALGALAGFDQINVLDIQKQDDMNMSGPDLTDTVTTATELVPVTEEIMNKVNEIKKWIADMWETLSTGATVAWAWVTEKWDQFSAWFTEHIAIPAKNIFGAIWDTFIAGVTVVIAIAKSLWDTFVAGAIVTGQILSSLWDLFKLGAGIILDWLSMAWDGIKAGAIAAWEAVVNAWGNAGDWFAEIWGNVSELVTTVWDGVQEAAHTAWESIQAVWAAVGAWFKSYVIDPIRTAFLVVWEEIGKTANAAWEKISETWNEVSAWFSENILNPLVRVFTNAWAAIGDMASDAWKNIQDVFGAIGNWLRDNVGDPIQSTFESALDWVQEKWQSVFEAIGNFVTDIINNIISALNGLLEGAVLGINGLIDGANLMGSIVPGWTNIPSVSAPQIPYLATGAVIPPNSKFLAMLGDQTSGKNIEAPVALLEQTFDKSFAKALQGQTININFTGSMSELVRVLKPAIDKENSRVGASLLRITG